RTRSRLRGSIAAGTQNTACLFGAGGWKERGENETGRGSGSRARSPGENDYFRTPRQRQFVTVFRIKILPQPGRSCESGKRAKYREKMTFSWVLARGLRRGTNARIAVPFRYRGGPARSLVYGQQVNQRIF